MLFVIDLVRQLVSSRLRLPGAHTTLDHRQDLLLRNLHDISPGLRWLFVRFMDHELLTLLCHRWSATVTSRLSRREFETQALATRAHSGEQL